MYKKITDPGEKEGTKCNINCNWKGKDREGKAFRFGEVGRGGEWEVRGRGRRGKERKGKEER